ncbi:MAG TPA: carbohydrate ABC transporter permease [Dongiaceae bacterium]|nr:carbohydrate ABC transporter permease [Dongiaceae bacterium]
MSAAGLAAPARGREAARHSAVTRAVIYALLVVFALVYLLPLSVMVLTSLKPLDEVTGGNMFALPRRLTFGPWVQAWGEARIGVSETAGIHGYFLNSVKMVIPAVIISTLLGALNGFVLTKWRFPGHNLVFGMMLFACFIPFQSVIIPMAVILGQVGRLGNRLRDLTGYSFGLGDPIVNLVTIHVIYGLGFTTLFFRNYYEVFPTELVKAAMMDGAGFFQIFRRIMLPSSGPIVIVAVIYQFTNIWNDFLFGSTFAAGDTAPMTVALNNLVNTSTGIVEYNVNMAAAIIAAIPTLLVYVVGGRYFIRGLMAGAVKG